MPISQIAAIAAAATGFAGTVAFSHRFRIRLRVALGAGAGGVFFAWLAVLLAQKAESLAQFAGGMLLLCLLGLVSVWAAARASHRLGPRSVYVSPEIARLAAAPAVSVSTKPSVAAPELSPVRKAQSGEENAQGSRLRGRGSSTGIKAKPKSPEAASPPPEEPAPEPPEEEPQDTALDGMERLAFGFKKEQERIAHAREKALMEQERVSREAAEKRREQELAAREAESQLVEKERAAREAEDRRRLEERLALEAELREKERERAEKEEERRRKERERRARREEERRMREEKEKQAAAEADEAQRIRDRIRAEKEKAEREEKLRQEEEARRAAQTAPVPAKPEGPDEWRHLTEELEKRAREQENAAEDEKAWIEEQRRQAREADEKRRAEADFCQSEGMRLIGLGMRVEALPWLEKAYRADKNDAAKALAGVAIVEALTWLGWKDEARRKMQAIRSEIKIDAAARKKLEELALKLLS